MVPVKRTGTDRCPDSALFRNPVNQFSEATAKLNIEGLFYAVSARAFIMHQRIKLIFQ
jgi:hypothetical protein